MYKYDDYLDFFLSKEKRASFFIEDGKGKVMVSSPHSVEQTREGRIKYGEYQTGVITKILHDITNCPIIYKAYNCGDDANYDEKSDYKEKLCQYVKANNIKFLIDLHQLAPWREENIDLGTGFGNNTIQYPDILEIVKEKFSKRFIGITVDYPFDASFPFTVSAYVSKNCDIPCIQIEINSRLVCEEYEDYSANDIIEALVEVILELNEVKH
jgi:hypothetical protein